MNLSRAHKNSRTARRRFLEIWRAGRPELAGSQTNHDRRFFGREEVAHSHSEVDFHSVSSRTQLGEY
jgi:hypothetical protein